MQNTACSCSHSYIKHGIKFKFSIHQPSSFGSLFALWWSGCFYLKKYRLKTRGKFSPCHNGYPKTVLELYQYFKICIRQPAHLTMTMRILHVGEGVIYNYISCHWWHHLTSSDAQWLRFAGFWCRCCKIVWATDSSQADLCNYASLKPNHFPPQLVCNQGS